LGFRYDHSFWRLRLEAGRHDRLPVLPGDIELTSYSATDILPYIDLINAAFADHPMPMRVTLEQIEHVHAHRSFDPAAIALLRNRSEQLVGFCTTGTDDGNGSLVGTIEMVGVLRDYRGRGLGRFLLLWGIDRLRSTGIETIELHVDGENENALGLYRSVGFEAVEEWPQWMRVT
jgi:mycothiol synthase